MKGSGGMLTFEVYSEKDAMDLLNNLGDTDTLIQHPASMTHAFGI
ncbi:MAG: hypothetical protein ACE5J9_11525 [Methanosarcinales archaeon]